MLENILDFLNKPQVKEFVKLWDEILQSIRNAENKLDNTPHFQNPSDQKLKHSILITEDGEQLISDTVAYADITFKNGNTLRVSNPNYPLEISLPREHLCIPHEDLWRFYVHPPFRDANGFAVSIGPVTWVRDLNLSETRVTHGRSWTHVTLPAMVFDRLGSMESKLTVPARIDNQNGYLVITHQSASCGSGSVDPDPAPPAGPRCPDKLKP